MVSLKESGPHTAEGEVRLVEDINEDLDKIPQSLEVLLSSLKNPGLNDCTVALLYTLMIETGFVPVNAENTVTDDLSTCYGFNAKKLETYTKMPNGWKIDGSNSYEIRFQIAPFSDHKCKLLVLSMLDLLVIDVFIEKHLDLDESPFVLCFTMTVCSSDHVTIEDNGQVKFNNVVELAHKFKNTVASPARASILNNCAVINPSLLGLPEEVTLKILSYLQVKDIGSASQTCRVLNQVSKDQHLWFNLVNRDWKLNKAWSDDINWTSFYERKEAQDRRKRSTPWNSSALRPSNASSRQLKNYFLRIFPGIELGPPGNHYLDEVQPSVRPGRGYPTGFLGRRDFYAHFRFPN